MNLCVGAFFLAAGFHLHDLIITGYLSCKRCVIPQRIKLVIGQLISGLDVIGVTNLSEHVHELCPGLSYFTRQVFTGCLIPHLICQLRKGFLTHDAATITADLHVRLISRLAQRRLCKQLTPILHLHARLRQECLTNLGVLTIPDTVVLVFQCLVLTPLSRWKWYTRVTGNKCVLTIHE